MLTQLREMGLALIASTPQCTLSTAGIAGVEATMVVCIVTGGRIYTLVPATADHLFNLEHNTEVVMTTNAWQVRGTARVISVAKGQGGTISPDILADANTQGLDVVEVLPLRMHVTVAGSWHTTQTIDFDPPAD